jgi:hypothetical protein
MGASECGEREIHKKEVCVYIYLLPFYIQTWMYMQLYFSLCAVNPLSAMFYKLLSYPMRGIIYYLKCHMLMYF